MTLLDAALDAHAAGLAVIPVRPDGTKAPAVNWKAFQGERPTLDQLTTWFTPQPDPWDAAAPAKAAYDGLGFVCGEISGHLEMLEVEGRATDLVAALAGLMTDNGFGDLWNRICTGYLEQSPSGGMHWLYRVDGESRGNTKLARRPMTPTELAAHKAHEVEAAQHIDNYGQRTERLKRIEQTTATSLPVVLIETRGEGGFTVASPSAGRSHPSGKPWMLLAGTPATIPTLSVDERDALHAIANMLDSMPEVEEITRPASSSRPTETPGDRPGDDYNARATWDDILTPLGWQRTKHFGGNCYGWTRPGKNAHDGISATTGRNEADNLFVFTSSTEFDTEKAYSKFSAITLLEYGGDYAAAAKALRGQGYGKPLEEARPTLTLVGSPVTQGETEAPESGSEGPPSGTSTPETVSPGPGSYSLTDDGNALRLIDSHATTIRYCPEAGSWLRWGGQRWVWDTAGHVHELARTIARGLPQEHEVQKLHRKKSLSNTGLKAMVNVARTDTRTIVSPDQLDARPYELNTPAGVVDLRTGTLTPPSPEALHTRITTVAPDFEAEAPLWGTFLADTFAGDPEMTVYIQRLLGLTLIGEHLEQILPFQWGSGANGKSTLMDVIQGIVGTGETGYSIPAPSELLLATTQHGHPTELARLSGARMVVSSELEDGERFAESRVKMLTGGDVIAARFMGKDFFSFTPTHTIWLHANEKPAVRAGGPALWRRLRLLPFVHVVPPEKRIAGLDRELVAAEGPAILAWVIRGAVDYLRDGLAEPDSVRVATSAYERDQDTVARFVEECCARGPQAAQGMSVRVAELRQAYENWCRTEGETPVSAKALTSALTARFDVVSQRSMSARFYAGIRLLDEASEPMTDLSLKAPNEPETGSDEWWNR